MANPLERPAWNRMLASVILTAFVIFIASVVYLYNRGIIPPDRAAVYGSLLGVIATVILAYMIFSQNVQTDRVIRQNRRQTLILQESEWMPDIEFYPDGKQFIFTNNRPSKVELTLTLNGESIVLENIEVKKGSAREYEGTEWVVGLGGVFEHDGFADREYEGQLKVKFESATGGEYECIYDVQVEVEDGDLSYNDVHGPRRKLPWDMNDQY